MNLIQAQTIYTTLTNSQHQVLAKSLLKAAVRYARMRVDWYLFDVEQRMELDAERTAAHNAFIDTCNIMSRNMAKAGEDISWRTAISNDRKIIGDFACLLHAVMGLMAR